MPERGPIGRIWDRVRGREPEEPAEPTEPTTPPEPTTPTPPAPEAPSSPEAPPPAEPHDAEALRGELTPEQQRLQKVVELVDAKWAKSDIRTRLEADFGPGAYNEVLGIINQGRLDELIEDIYGDPDQAKDKELTLRWRDEALMRLKKFGKREAIIVGVSAAGAMVLSALTGLGAMGAIASPVFLRGIAGRLGFKAGVETARVAKGTERKLVEEIIQDYLERYKTVVTYQQEQIKAGKGIPAGRAEAYKEAGVAEQKETEALNEALIELLQKESEGRAEKVKQFHEVKAAWDKWSERAALVGSAVGILSGAWAHWQNIVRGVGTRLNIDVDNIVRLFGGKGGEQGAHIVKVADGAFKFVSNAGKDALLQGFYGGGKLAAGIGVAQRVAAEGLAVIGAGLVALWRDRVGRAKEKETRETRQREYKEKLAEEIKPLEIKEPEIPYQKGEIVMVPAKVDDHQIFCRMEITDISKDKAALKNLDDDENSGNSIKGGFETELTVDELNQGAQKGAYTKEEKERYGLGGETGIPEEMERFENIKEGLKAVFREGKRPRHLAEEEYKILKVNKDRNEIVLYGPAAPDKRFTFKLTYLLTLADLRA